MTETNKEEKRCLTHLSTKRGGVEETKLFCSAVIVSNVSKERRKNQPKVPKWKEFPIVVVKCILSYGR